MIRKAADDVTDMTGAPSRAGAQAPWSASELLVLALGVGLYLGWRTIDISPTLFPPAHTGVEEALTGASYVGTALSIAVFLGVMRLTARRGPVLGVPWLIGIACVGPAVATGLMYLCGWLLPQAWMPGVAVGRALYFTSALLLVLWGELLCSIGWKNVLVTVAGGYLVAFCVCLVSAGLDAPGVFAFRTACPLASGAALFALARDRGRTVAAAQPGALDQASMQGRLPIRVFVGIAVFGGVFAVANSLSETKTTVSTELFTLYAGVAVSLAVLVVGAATRRRAGNFSFLFRLLTPLVVICLLMTLLLEEGAQHYEAFAIGFSWVFFRIFTWAMWTHVGSQWPGRGAAAFAMGQLCLTVAATLAELMCSLVDLSAVPLPAAVSAIILVTVVTSALVMDEGSVLRLLSCAKAQSGGASAPAQSSPLDPRDATATDIARAMAPCGLSERECQIALLVMRGGDNASVCEAACITESTLRTHLRNIYGKTSTHSRSELIEALKQGVASLSSQ